MNQLNTNDITLVTLQFIHEENFSHFTLIYRSMQPWYHAMSRSLMRILISTYHRLNTHAHTSCSVESPCDELRAQSLGTLLVHPLMFTSDMQSLNCSKYHPRHTVNIIKSARYFLILSVEQSTLGSFLAPFLGSQGS